MTRVKVAAHPSFEEVVASLDRQHEKLCSASAGLLETVAYLDEMHSWGDDETSLECFLSARYSVSSGTAYEWVRVSRALRSLPAIRESFASGQLSWDQLRPLTKVATSESDQRLANEAPNMRVGRLWREARRLERSRNQKEMKDDHQVRNFHMQWDEEKRFLHVQGTFAAEQGAAFQEAVERRAAEIKLEEDDPPFDRHGARQADAVAELVTSSNGEDAPPATLVVHADAAVLARDGSDRSGDSGGSATETDPDETLLAETESGAQLTDEAVRRLACDARIEWVLEADGRAVGIGRRGRAVPGWLLRPLKYRDPECRFDGCSRTQSLISHHVVHWADGGPTDLDNLIRLCKLHHRLLHECGWIMTGHPGAEVRFHRPRAGPDRPKSRPMRELVASAFP
jgi:hypothetical protein